MRKSILNPFDYEIFYNRLFNILCESRDIIRHLSGSAIVREAGETAQGICLPNGELVLLSPGLLLHLNTVPRVIKYLIQNKFAQDVEFNDGDQFLCNDPVIASMHRMDMVLVAPFFYDGEHVAWLGNYGHVPEIGATEPGGHPMIAEDAYHEGICLTPIKIVERGKVRRDLVEMLTRVVREPRLMELDTKAKIAANERTRKNLKKIIDDFGIDFYQAASKKLLDDAEAQSRALVKMRKPGKYRAQVFTDHVLPGQQELRVMQLELEITGEGQLIVRAPVVSPQSRGPYNACLPCLEGNIFCLTLSHIFYKTRWNGGVVRVYTTDVPCGSMINCDSETAVNFGTVGTGMHAATAISEILSRAAFIIGEHQDIIAPSGLVNQLMYGGIDQFGRRCGKYVMDYLTTGGGAKYGKDGTDSGVSQINPWTYCGDVEGNEAVGPILELGRRHMPNTGGFGKCRGGAAAHTVLMIHKTKSLVVGNMGQGRFVTVLQGLYGGYPPSATRLIKIRDANLADLVENRRPLPHEIADFVVYPFGKKEDVYVGAKFDPMGEGDLVGTIYWGGAGVMDPIEREPEKVAKDVQGKVITLEAALKVYCVAMDEASLAIDIYMTAKRREEKLRERLTLGIYGPEYLRKMVQFREKRDLPAPVLRLFDQLLATPWSKAFRDQLCSEKKFAARTEEAVRIVMGGEKRDILHLTPYVKFVQCCDGVFAVCCKCGHLYCNARENFKLFCLIYDRDPMEVHFNYSPDRDWMIYREFYCPNCAAQVEVEAVPQGWPILNNIELNKIS